MLKIAICDDVLSDAEQLKGQIDRFKAENGSAVEISVFITAENIKETLSRSQAYDVIFLDIFMDSLNGIELARHIARSGEKSRIIFFSSTKEYALQAFGVNALQYLTKPVEYEALENALKLVLADKASREEAISITVGTEIVKLPLDKIVFSESERNYQHIHLENGETYKTRMTCTELYGRLAERREFERVGASYIVNLRFVFKISAGVVKMANGASVPVPRRAVDELIQKYKNYFS